MVARTRVDTALRLSGDPTSHATLRAQLLLCVDNYSAWWYAVKLSLELDAGDP